jgi:hypothetical protein
MSASSTDAPGVILDVYGIKSHRQAKRLLVDFLSIGFRPAVMFAVDRRCRTVVAVELGKHVKLVYAKVGGPKSGIVQWSLAPQVFSSRLRRTASAALESHLSGNLRQPLRLRYG